MNRKRMSAALFVLPMLLVVLSAGVVFASAAPRYMGDINADSRVNSSDARIILRYAAKLDPLPDGAEPFADMTADRRVNSADARVILRMAAKLEALVMPSTTDTPPVSEELPSIPSKPTVPEPTAPEPTVPEPPTTAEPATDEPATDEPATDEPVTDEPATDEPVTDEPATDEPVTDEPVTDEPVTDEPVTDEPATDEPVTDEPVTDEPATDEPVTDEPVTDEPVTDEPATDEPATDEPVTEEPTTEAPPVSEPPTETTVNSEYLKNCYVDAQVENFKDGSLSSESRIRCAYKNETIRGKAVQQVLVRSDSISPGHDIGMLIRSDVGVLGTVQSDYYIINYDTDQYMCLDSSLVSMIDEATLLDASDLITIPVFYAFEGLDISTETIDGVDYTVVPVVDEENNETTVYYLHKSEGSAYYQPYIAEQYKDDVLISRMTFTELSEDPEPYVGVPSMNGFRVKRSDLFDIFNLDKLVEKMNTFMSAAGLGSI